MVRSFDRAMAGSGRPRKRSPKKPHNKRWVQRDRLLRAKFGNKPVVGGWVEEYRFGRDPIESGYVDSSISTEVNVRGKRKKKNWKKVESRGSNLPFSKRRKGKKKLSKKTKQNRRAMKNSVENGQFNQLVALGAIGFALGNDRKTAKKINRHMDELEKQKSGRYKVRQRNSRSSRMRKVPKQSRRTWIDGYQVTVKNSAGGTRVVSHDSQRGLAGLHARRGGRYRKEKRIKKLGLSKVFPSSMMADGQRISELQMDKIAAREPYRTPVAVKKQKKIDFSKPITVDDYRYSKKDGLIFKQRDSSKSSKSKRMNRALERQRIKAKYRNKPHQRMNQIAEDFAVGQDAATYGLERVRNRKFLRSKGTVYVDARDKKMIDGEAVRYAANMQNQHKIKRGVAKINYKEQSIARMRSSNKYRYDNSRRGRTMNRVRATVRSRVVRPTVKGFKEGFKSGGKRVVAGIRGETITRRGLGATYSMKKGRGL